TGASDDANSEPSDQDSCGATAGAAAGTRVPSKRQVILYAHLTDAAICDMINRGTAGERAPVWMGRVENTSTPITAETIREWCSGPSTRVTVRPGLDLNGYQHADSYEVPSRIKEQIRLRDGTCVFPNCHARAIYCQDDHVEPFDHDNPEEGGRTESTNLRLLC